MIKFDFCIGDWDDEERRRMKDWLAQYGCRFTKMRKEQDDIIIYAEAPDLLSLGQFLCDYNADWGPVKTEADVAEYFDYLFGEGDGWRERIKYDGRL